MAYSQASLALELYRPTIGRYAPMLLAVSLVGALCVAVSSSSDRPPSIHELGQTVTDESAAKPMAPVDTATVKAGELDVPVYYFPDAATGTDRYVGARESDCAG